MKLARVCAMLLGIAILFPTSTATAQGWSMPKIFSGSQNKSKPSSSTRALQKLGTGTKKFVSGTVDVITLKPLRDFGKTQKPWKPFDPWMRSTRKTAEKKPLWNSWVTPKNR